MTRPDDRAALQAAPCSPLRQRFEARRAASVALACGLSDADATIQSMPDASPAKWHLAHTSWFFEAFVLCETEGYERFDPAYDYLFNSYYEGVGARHERSRRGMISRPSLAQVLDYRAHVDAAVVRAIEGGRADEGMVALGLAHEEQHQELLLTDILHAFSRNPAEPAYRPPVPLPLSQGTLSEGWTAHPGGTVRIGSADTRAFDCEGPPHDVLLQPFLLKNRTVTGAEWRAFITDGGYDDPLLWLSDGWAWRQREGIVAPLYWRDEGEGAWSVLTLRGRQPVQDDAPVAHVSQYEADAYARWAGARLPTEFEWEAVAREHAAPGNDAGTERLRPAPQVGEGVRGLLGDVWEWTASAYLPYPRFEPAPGAVGEYNGKFMSGQMVLRGGSCATAPGHAGPTYRNFFPPSARWQFSGLRLARDE